MVHTTSTNHIKIIHFLEIAATLLGRNYEHSVRNPLRLEVNYKILYKLINFTKIFY